jgi:hypothetical protein
MRQALGAVPAPRLWTCPAAAMSSKHKKQGKKKDSGGISKNQQKRLKQFQQSIETQNTLFNNYFIAQYGAERWERLAKALQKKPQYVAMINKRADMAFTHRLLGIDTGRSVPFLPELFHNSIYIHNRDIGKEIVEEEGKTVGIKEEVESGNESDSDVEDSPPAATTTTSTSSTMMNTTDIDDDEEDLTTMLWPAPSGNMDSNGLCVYYPLDAASLFPVLQLQQQSHHKVTQIYKEIA